MAVRQSIHIEAPVEKVFDFWKDPANWWAYLAPDQRIRLTEAKVTKEGVGTYYNWEFKLAGLRMEGFGVFTEFVPNERITDKASRALDGTWVYEFEPEGSGTKFTMQRFPRSFWRLAPFDTLMDRFEAPRHEKALAMLKAKLEAEKQPVAVG
jgi:hypothetical protein